MTMNQPVMTRDALAALLDLYGGEPARWPEADRAAATRLIETSVAAKRAWQEAQALELVLARAPVVDAARRAPLTDRIVAAALAKPRVAEAATDRSAGNVIALSQRRPREPLSRPMTGAAAAIAMPRRSVWQAAAVLAASLMMGMMFGTTDLVSSRMLGAFDVSGTHRDAEDVVAALQFDGLSSALEEDRL